MTRWKNALFNTTIAIDCLLCFLVLFESRLVIPSWLQVAGRMHPLVIHFPIVLLILFIGQQFLLRQKQDNTLLLLTALTAAITATMGLLLSIEPGYDADALTTHKWSGIFFSFLTLAWYAWFEKIQQIKWAPATTAVVALALLTFAGHEGATITHG